MTEIFHDVQITFKNTVHTPFYPSKRGFWVPPPPFSVRLQGSGNRRPSFSCSAPARSSGEAPWVEVGQAPEMIAADKGAGSAPPPRGAGRPTGAFCPNPGSASRPGEDKGGRGPGRAGRAPGGRFPWRRSALSGARTPRENSSSGPARPPLT